MTTPETQPAAPEPERTRFQFTLRTLLLLFVVLGSSLGVYGAWGILVFFVVVGLAVLHQVNSHSSLAYSALMVMFFIALGVLLPQLSVGNPSICWNWPNIAALAVWLVSVGTLLTNAVRSRKALSVPTPSS